MEERCLINAHRSIWAHLQAGNLLSGTNNSCLATRKSEFAHLDPFHQAAVIGSVTTITGLPLLPVQCANASANQQPDAYSGSLSSAVQD